MDRGSPKIWHLNPSVEILEVLKLHGSTSLPRISELTKLSELECSSTLSHLITQGYVFRVEDKFTISFFGKSRLNEERK